MATPTPQHHQEQRGRSAAQVVTTLVSLLLIVLLAGTILYEGYARGEARPAELKVTVDSTAAEQRGTAYYVPFTVRNLGDETVEVALVTFEVYRDGEPVLETDTTIDLLGERAMVSGVLVLDEVPDGLEFVAQVTSFQIAEE
jgi:uncharacterized protein (TIGR02588 family)